MWAGVSLNEGTRSFLPRFGLTARKFHALRAVLEGKIASMGERQPRLIAEATERDPEKRKTSSCVIEMMNREKTAR
ncbi:hypothetical protein MPNT_120063 [Candidatus Methylacidithermus pantelleriae]|uniref:Uncharacterized protein n=1 Tax=Candidatus Methylacidithermus pantelleriae TaxID=2744239 RepID=A0A8J2BR66_9BACT|nr:hypothetical protein MPNT_120063 [Candidatus Methylacidithermus pantelleriae]